MGGDRESSERLGKEKKVKREILGKVVREVSL